MNSIDYFQGKLQLKIIEAIYSQVECVTQTSFYLKVGRFQFNGSVQNPRLSRPVKTQNEINAIRQLNYFY